MYGTEETIRLPAKQKGGPCGRLSQRSTGLRRLRKRVFMLAVANDQHAFAGMLAHDKLKSRIRWINGDERDGSVVIFARRHLALPLAEVKGHHAVLVEHRDLTELLA